MCPIFTFIVSTGAVLSEAVLCFAAGADKNTFSFFICWTGAPYLGYCGLALGRRTYRSTIFVSTLISAGLASFLYWSSTWPMVAARLRGEEAMNCAGPLAELGFPIVQWFFAMVLFVATRPEPAASGKVSAATLDLN